MGVIARDVKVNALAELCRPFAGRGLTVIFTDAAPALYVAVYGSPMRPLRITVDDPVDGADGHFRWYHGTDVAHPVEDVAGAASLIVEHVIAIAEQAGGGCGSAAAWGGAR